MYLSRLILNPRSRQARNELADPYELHRTICRAFPAANYKDNESSGILFRVDLHPRTHIPTLLVQSRQKPNWEFLSTEKKDYLLGENDLPLDVENPAFRELNLQLREGQTLAFRLRANPTVKKDREGKKQGRRVGLIHEADQQKWIKRKLESAGAALISVNIINERFTHGKLFIEKEKTKRLSLLSVQFNGVLQVKNPEELASGIFAGFGSAKGLGFGLLSLARVPSG
ncbi:MAG: type I-E CRISPR-associated protein Cas6/Cse3/CasE [Anaerolineales bacterium]|nr:MAG: type I-E CRISPR-associated protein Cas6/Cse3/CasE [Anaerolineales bacterium]